MLIDVDPVLLSFGPLAVRWFGLLAGVGLAVAIWLSLRELRRQRLSRKLALDALAWGLPAGLVTAWLVHRIGYWDYYLTNAGAAWQLSVDSLSLWGGLVGGCLVGAARLRRDPIPRRRILDAIVPFAALGIAIGRFGEFLDGHGQGLPSTLPWATQYANRLAASPDFGVLRHPAQLYDGLFVLALFAMLIVLQTAVPAGSRLAIFFVLYGLERLVIGQVRLDPSFLFGLQIEQLLALGCVGFGLVYGLQPWLRRVTRHKTALDGGRRVPASPTSEEKLAA
jgi:phosphatidylglycerol:prolipoprotein diacylglycerol transferase